MSTDITTALDGLDPTVIEAINKPEVLERLSAYVEKAKEPVLSKNNEVLGKYSSLKEQIDLLGGLETIKSLKSAADAAQRDKQEALANSGNLDAIRAQYEANLREKDEALTNLQQSIVKEKTGSAIAKALRDADADADLLFPHLQRRIRSELKDGKVSLTVLDADGQPMITKDMKEAGLKDLVAEYQEKHPSAFKTKTVTGSGASNSATVTGVRNPWMPETRSYPEQNRIALENPKLAVQLAALAGKQLKL